MKFCEACHTANKDRARYCCGCKGRFSGVRFAANTSASTAPGSLEASSTPPVPTRTLNRADPARSQPGKRTGLRVLFLLLLLLGAFAYWYSSQLALGWSTIENAVSSSAASLTSRIDSLRESLASEEVSIVETEVQPTVAASSREPPVPRPEPATVSQRRGDDVASRPRSSDAANAFESGRKAPRAAAVERVQPSVAIGSAFQEPAPPAPTDAPGVDIPAPERVATEPKEKECSETLAALALCPK